MVSSSAPGGNVLPVDSQVTERPGKLVLLSFKHKWQEQDIELLAPPSVMGRGAFVARVSAGAGFEAAWLVSVPDGTPVKKHVGKVATVEEARPDQYPNARPPRRLTRNQWRALALAADRGVRTPFSWGDDDNRYRPEVAWVWDEVIPDAGITLFTGVPKAGKTTCLRQLLGAVATGAPFLGRRTFGTQDDVDGGPFGMASLVLSEEPQEAWRGDRPADVAVWPRTGEVVRKRGEWDDLVGQIKVQVGEYEFSVLVLDTFTGLVGVNENSPTSLAKAVAPLRDIYGPAGLVATILVHHSTKAGGNAPGLNARGSGALPGLVDSVIELDRVSDDPLDPRRRLTVVGRLGPARVIEYAMDAGGRLVAADELRPKAARKGGLKFAAGGN